MPHAAVGYGVKPARLSGPVSAGLDASTGRSRHATLMSANGTRKERDVVAKMKVSKKIAYKDLHLLTTGTSSSDEGLGLSLSRFVLLVQM
jgi:hypothetical protein